MRQKRLGRGLSNLISPTSPPDAIEERIQAVPATEATAASDGRAGIQEIPVAQIRSNPFQPRTTFEDAALDELAASIREHGVLQPVVVRKAVAGRYELVAGERRLRASQRVGLMAIPAVVRPATDAEMQTLALVENLQREDLNAMEKARALKAMMRNLELRQEDVAERVGKARTTIANILRLLDLPGEVQALVEEGVLSGAHARAVLAAEGDERRIELAKLAAAKGLSVRAVEKLAKGLKGGGARAAREEDPYVRDLEGRLKRALWADVRLRGKGKGGTIEIRYHDPDELDGLLERLGA